MDKAMFTFYKNALLGTNMIEPLCDEYKGLWKACEDDKEKLLRLALRQQSAPYVATMCYLGKGLTKEYIKEAFKDYINGHKTNDADNVEGYTYALYVDYDEASDLVIDTHVAHIMWTKSEDVVIPETKCPTIYVSNKSDLHITGGGYNSIRLYVFDESSITLEDVDETCSVIVYKYSDKAHVELGKFCLGKVNIHDKELRL